MSHIRRLKHTLFIATAVEIIARVPLVVRFSLNDVRSLSSVGGLTQEKQWGPSLTMFIQCTCEI